jgi:hypothetical protein
MFLPCSVRVSLWRVVAPLGAGLIAFSAFSKAPVQAQTPAPVAADVATFVVDANDGYGVMDCLIDGVACGKIVADAFCESHGRHEAVAFGLASDITGATPGATPSPVKAGPNDVIISCKN